jgi:hypothetical protein
MWTALYNDEERLFQYKPDGREKLFKEIDLNRLIKFIVRDKGREVIVDTQTGHIKIDGKKLDFGYGDSEYRLIYFRRVRRTLGTFGVKSGVDTIEYVGWQTTIQGVSGSKNVKRIIGIHADKVTIQCD